MNRLSLPRKIYLYIRLLLFLTAYMLLSAYIAECRANTDSLVIIKLLEQADKAADENSAESHRLFREVKRLTDNEPLRLYYAKAIYMDSYVSLQEAKYQDVIDNCTKAAAIFTKLHRSIDEAKCYSRIGLAWLYLSDYARSLHFLFHALRLAEDANDLKLVSAAYTNIGLVYESLEDWENTLKYAQKSIEIKKQLRDTAGLGKVYGNIANAYYYQKQDSLAAVYLRLARQYHIWAKDSLRIATSANDYGSLLAEQKQYDTAIHYFNLALSYYDTHQDAELYSYCILQTNLGMAYLNKGNLSMAQQLISHCTTCEAEIKELPFVKSLSHFKYEYYKKTGNTTAALRNMELMYAANDSIYQQSRNFEHQRVAIRYEFDQKAKQDSLNYQLKLSEQEKNTAEYKNRMYLLALCVLLTGSVAGFFYSRASINRKKQQIALQQTQLAEAKALRAQMNPHFIFNCLNTIDAFVLQNKQEDASRLIQRFSKLSRRILEHTSMDFITLQQELETLNIYLQIEQTRKGNQFRYTINADPDTLKYLIPPMLLQPFVENAVLHGMKGVEKGEGCITISTAKDNKYIFIEIEDNGIGRQKAMELKQAQPETHRSLSMEMTLQRLQRLHGHKRQEEYLRFTDFQTPHKGTRVEVVIPLQSLSL